MNAVGHEHGREHEGDGHQRSAHFVHRAPRRVPRRHALVQIPLDVLHDDNRIVHDDADREHEAEERQRVQRKSERLQHGERADERDGNRQQRNHRCAPRLEEEDDDHHDEDGRFVDRLLNLGHRFGDELRGVVDDVVVEPGRELGAQTGHQRLDPPRRRERV